MAIEVHVVRDERVRPGGEGVVELPGELLFVVSAHGVSERGAAALVDSWRWFIDRGIWRYGAAGGDPVTTVYHHAQRGREPVRVRCSRDAAVDVWCSPEHFCLGTVNGLQVAARSSIRRGWRYYAPSSLDRPVKAS